MFTVYPRTYGEHFNIFTACGRIGGLSPYLRGTPFFSKMILSISRFIPVLTGNTIRLMQSPAAWPVYPRTYGEHNIK
ncbi:conserved hypothetical protein [Xenorhabdus nematophila ATCC 19061]|nr:conserved hypothetical protein [Xenorhabdus nematophila ATCC 19061]